ncbi:WD repeat-containing protein 93 isoform X1 [Lingula anatina]|uniref:WD repeat-containing protein 93 isoform X1 n=1 Tax=Lingula anatina TaxID=7574 RepID=A0A2R2MPX4_LINAN|nr:WD repeat-containing protein 93 isoform X1 [Lingula anatina]|eukprot:XP_023932289.1 WD repeat-containing protein 93 isoform X1 [Lingula anatina]
MPVYIRKTMVISPPSILSRMSDDEDDYLTDPDQIRDLLPQPYRMINKIIYNLFDDIWEIISERENARIAEASRIKPPKYECAIQMQPFGQATCLSDSIDGRYIFIGLPNGLAAVDAMTQQTVTTWEDDKIEVTQMQVSLIGVQTYLLCTVDDMGVSRFFAFAQDRIHLLKVASEQGGSGSKTIITKCQASTEGDFVGIVFEDTSNKETWIEVQKLPRDDWLRELEATSKKSTSQTKPQSPAPLGDDSDAPADGEQLPGEEKMIDAEDAEKEEKQSVGQRSQSPTSSRGAMSPVPPGGGGSSEKMHTKFSTPTLVVKIRPPADITGCNASTPQQATKLTDTGEVIGSGSNHSLTAHHLENRKAVFDYFHEQHLRYLPKEEESAQQPMFHFFTAGRLLPTGLDMPGQEGRPSSIGVWWVGGTQVFYYSLVKASKDIEHKPEFVSPHSDVLTATAVSQCTSLLAVGLKNGIVVIWDMHIGVNRRLINLTDDATILKLVFLNPNICGQDKVHYPPYGTKTNSYLLAWCSDGSVYLINCGMGKTSQPITVMPKMSDQDNLPTMVEPVNGVPEVILVVKRNGTAFLLDVTKGNSLPLCQVNLPTTHELTTPWDPVITVGGQGHMMYLKASQKDPSEDYVPNSGMSSLFVFTLRSFPTLDDYLRRQRPDIPYVIHNTVDKRIETLLKERINQQASRQRRMQERWINLKNELDIIQQIKDTNKRNADLRSEYVSVIVFKLSIIVSIFVEHIDSTTNFNHSTLFKNCMHPLKPLTVEVDILH